MDLQKTTRFMMTNVVSFSWQADAMSRLHKFMNGYHPLVSTTWDAFAEVCRPIALKKHTDWVPFGEIPKSFGFLYSGLIRAYTLNSNGKEYNKIFFTEGTMPGSIVALLRGEPSEFAFQALEDSLLIDIDHGRYRELLKAHPDLLMYHCMYLEANWVMAKEPREVAFAQQTAKERYAAFLNDHPDLEKRLSQAHIAAHLGVTPTQLSRIRRTKPQKDPTDQHM